MTVVGLARCAATYSGLDTPFAPAIAYPEIEKWLGDGESLSARNEVYDGFRSALRLAGLDVGRFDTSEWNPIGDLVEPGGHIVLKPNFIRHWNPNPSASVESVITHGSILRGG